MSHIFSGIAVSGTTTTELVVCVIKWCGVSENIGEQNSESII